MNKTNLNLKLFFFLKVFLLYIFFINNSNADNLKKENSLIVLGSEDAAVKVKIFSSFTCPHCASFHLNVVSKLKEDYINSGKVQLIFIDFPLDQAAFNASKILHCLASKERMIFMDTIYNNQSQWTVGSNINQINNNLKKIVKDLGINSNQFDECLKNKIIENKVLNGRIDAHKEYSITATPTVVINNKKIEDNLNLNDIIKKIEKLI